MRGLGGQASHWVVFGFVDHGPVPGAVAENTVWLSNDPSAADARCTLASLALAGLALAAAGVARRRRT